MNGDTRPVRAQLLSAIAGAFFLLTPSVAAAALNDPHGLAASPQGDIYVADTGDNQVVKFSSSGQVEATIGGLAHPEGVAVAADSNVYVADTYHNQVAVFSAQGTPLRRIGRYSFEPKPGTMNAPHAVAVGQYLYVSDSGSDIQRYSLAGAYLGSFGSYSLHHKAVTLRVPSALTVDKQGRVYVADSGTHTIVVFSAKGKYLKTFAISELDSPTGLAFGDGGNLFVSNAYASNKLVAGHEQVLEYNGRRTVRGWGIPCPTGCTYGEGGSEPGQLSAPRGIAVIGSTLYVANSGDNRIEIFNLNGSYLGQWAG